MLPVLPVVYAYMSELRINVGRPPSRAVAEQRANLYVHRCTLPYHHMLVLLTLIAACTRSTLP
jgi:hypothetical protein